MSVLTVGTSKSYPINVTRGLGELKDMAKAVAKGKKVAIVTDDIVSSLYNETIDFAFEDKELLKIVIPHGEENKNAENYLHIINLLAENKFTRKDTLVTFGGGVIGDIGAFAASTYMRGISLLAIPTTILSMVDSSVGGKTAIDLTAGKNLLGTFYQPNGVYINLDFIKTLPKREILSGYGEIIKYAFLDKTIQPVDLNEITEEVIINCLKIKKDIVEKDEKEKDIRKLLNLGHTLGHAIESLENYKLSHGECVLKGIVYAIEISKKLYHLDEEITSKMLELVNVKGKVKKSDFTTDELMEKITSDKKSDASGVDFVLIKDIGNLEIKHLTFEELKKLLEN